MKTLHYSIILIITAVIYACGGGSSSEGQTEGETTQEAVTEEAVADTAFLVIEGNDLMQFNLDGMEATEGQIVKLTLKHVGQMSVDAMGHNWVLLKPGTDKASFGAAAVSARDTDYIPQDMTNRVLANTKTIGGGEETTIVFEAPSLGYYDYLCTFPGHWGVMQGTLTVNPR